MRRSAPARDIAFLGGVINYLLTNDKIQREYVKNYTDFILHREARSLRSRTASTPATTRKSAATTRPAGTTSSARTASSSTDPTLEHPRCVYKLMKQHYARYTPEMVERVCGTPKDKFLQICEMIASTATPGRAR